jgi:hypothetical protein
MTSPQAPTACLHALCPGNGALPRHPPPPRLRLASGRLNWQDSAFPGGSPRCYAQVGDPRGLVPLVNKIGWLRRGQKDEVDPHVLVTWVKEIRWLCGQAGIAGESDSPSGRAGWGLRFPGRRG